MRMNGTISLLVSSLLVGCYDFGKIHDTCMDSHPFEECEGDQSGGSPGSGGTSGDGGGLSSGGITNTGGALSGGTSGTGGSGTGGENTGGSGTGGAGAGGVGTGGASGGTGGTGGVSTTLVERAKLNEACPSTQAVEIYNPGPTPIPLSELKFSATKTTFTLKAECVLSGELAANGYIVFAASASGCAGVTGTCVSDCFVSFDSTSVNAWFRLGSENVAVGSFNDDDVKPAISQCWVRTNSDGVSLTSTPSLGQANP